jgi:hypothetical protein
MTEALSLADRMRERYPEGLTGILAVGGTRTSYILEHHRNSQHPGAIESFGEYADYSINQLLNLISIFFELGGQNVVVPLFSYQGFYERGDEYGRLSAQICLSMIDPRKIDFYHAQQADPYFVGIDTLLHLPEDRYEHQLGRQFAEFQKAWQYKEGRRKIIWEVAPIPLYSIWNAQRVMGEAVQAEFEAALAAATDLTEMHDLLYRYYARAVYGTDLPVPHFYLGSNRNGDLKLRSLLPIALLCGGPFRMFFTPYPSLFMTKATLQAILEDLAFGKAMRSRKLDYSGQLPTGVVEVEYQRVLELSATPDTTLGLFRQITSNGNG